MHTGGIIILDPYDVSDYLFLLVNPGIAPSRYDVLFPFLLFWFVGGMFDDLTFYQVRIIGGEMNQGGGGVL